MALKLGFKPEKLARWPFPTLWFLFNVWWRVCERLKSFSV